MMAVNLSKHGAELSDAYTEVVNGKPNTDWVLFTYEGNSYDIHVASKGGGGLDEMVQNFSANKVMYAFCRVTDPKCGVPKLILINWTGEGVTGLRRVVCSNHLQTMASFLRGAHVTINAYSEDDVQPEIIISKVSQAVGVNYSLHTESNQFNDTAAPRPVGSVYNKTSGLLEIKGTDRETFWAQIEKEEQTRRQQERKKAEEERQRLEKERKKQEERERAERERLQRERAKQIDQQRLFEKRQEINHQNQEHQEPGAKYSKHSALKEINSTARENFWAQLEKEEQTHCQQESKKAEEKRQRLEKERKKLEERETAERERRQRERDKQIDQQRLFEKRQEINHQNQQHQEPKEDQTRHQQERKKAEEEHQRLEKERKEQEEKETGEREQCQKERAKENNQQRLFEKRQKMNQQNQQRLESGSKYSKSSALEEINQTDREIFWAQLEKEEQTRRQQERKKAQEERQRFEKERKEQEERETAERERRQRERAKQIDQQRLQEKKQEAKDITQQQLVERELQAAQWKGIKSSKSVQEANEAAALISQRAINPRNIFSQKETNFLTSTVLETQPGKSNTNAYKISTNGCNEEENIFDTVPSHYRVYHKVEDDRRSAGKQSAGLQRSLYAKALYDYQASDDTEITFDPGDIITVVEMADEGWWHGYGPGGHYGMFPANYVELI